MTPLVLVHGMLGAPASFDGLRAHLGERSVHAVTLPGHGFSGLAMPKTFEEAADWLAADLAGRWTEPIDLLGYSLGARVSLAMCARHPDRFRHATFVSLHPGLPSAVARSSRVAEDEALAEMAERDLPAFVAHWEKLPIFATQSPAQIDAQRATRLAHDPHGIAAAFRRLGLGVMPDLSAALDRLAPRVRLITGSLDTKFYDLARTLVAQTRRIGLDVLPGVGHNPLIEAPLQLARLLG